MGSSEKSMRKIRKLTYDEYSGSFSMESRSEAVDRLSRLRERETDILNRAKCRQLDQVHRQVENDRTLFSMRFSREREEARASLKDALAYRSVLGKIVQANDQYPVLDERLGSYGQDGFYFQMLPLIEMEKKTMTSEFARRRKADQLLKQRRPMAVMDRRQQTDELLRSWRSRSDSPGRPGRGRLPPSRNNRIRHERHNLLPPLQTRETKELTSGRSRVDQKEKEQGRIVISREQGEQENGAAGTKVTSELAVSPETISETSRRKRNKTTTPLGRTEPGGPHLMRQSLPAIFITDTDGEPG